MPVTLTRTNDLEKLAVLSAELAEKARQHMTSCKAIYVRVMGKNRTVHPDIPSAFEISAKANFVMARARFIELHQHSLLVAKVLAGKEIK